MHSAESGAIHSTKISGNFGPKLNGSVRSNWKSFEKTGPPFEVDHFSRSDRSGLWIIAPIDVIEVERVILLVIKVGIFGLISVIKKDVLK